MAPLPKTIVFTPVDNAKKHRIYTRLHIYIYTYIFVYFFIYIHLYTRNKTAYRISGSHAAQTGVSRPMRFQFSLNELIL